MCFPLMNTFGTVRCPVHSASADWISLPSPSIKVHACKFFSKLSFWQNNIIHAMKDGLFCSHFTSGEWKMYWTWKTDYYFPFTNKSIEVQWRSYPSLNQNKTLTIRKLIRNGSCLFSISTEIWVISRVIHRKAQKDLQTTQLLPEMFRIEGP